MNANRQVCAWVVALVACAGCSSSEGTTPPPGGSYGPDSSYDFGGDGGSGNGGDGSGGKGGKGGNGGDGGTGNGSKDGASDSKGDGKKGDGSGGGGGNGDGSGGGGGNGDGSGGGGGADGPTDGPTIDHVLGLGSCKGTAQSISISRQLPYVDLKVGSEMGEFGMDFGSTFSTIDLSAFDSPGPTTSGCDASELGQVCTVAGFSFFGTTASVQLTTENYLGLGGSVRQAGLVGTDLLKEQVFIIDYQGRNLYAAPAACTDNDLKAAGYVQLTTAGFYENDVSKLYPVTDTGIDAAPGTTVQNIPTVPVTVAGVPALAQLDTGFDDSATPYSVNVNKAFYDSITGAQSNALVRDSSKDVTVTTCAKGADGGFITETDEAYTLKSGVTFEFMQGNGMVARTYTSAVLFVKNTPTAALVCGGISTWKVPAAQVGASFFVDMRSIVFDPFGASVWMPL